MVFLYFYCPDFKLSNGSDRVKVSQTPLLAGHRGRIFWPRQIFPLPTNLLTVGYLEKSRVEPCLLLVLRCRCRLHLRNSPLEEHKSDRTL